MSYPHVDWPIRLIILCSGPVRPLRLPGASTQVVIVTDGTAVVAVGLLVVVVPPRLVAAPVTIPRERMIAVTVTEIGTTTVIVGTPGTALVAQTLGKKLSNLHCT